MRAEIVAVGTELLLGQIANTNAQRISNELAAIGVDVYFHTVVGDNLARAAETIGRAVRRADAVIVTGGLGPTPDDLTREAVALVARVPLRRDDRLEAELRTFFAGRNRPMPPENLKQADLPDGATPIEPEGTAPGFQLQIGASLLFALPGVPWEMQAMLGRSVVPALRERSGAVLLSREVLVIGLGESHVHARIADLVEAQSNPTLAYLAGRGQVRVRLSAKADDEAAADALLAPLESEIRQRLGDNAVQGRHRSLAGALGAMLRERGATVAVAESLTGGKIGAEITSVAGASDYFLGSLVCYTSESKARIAGVDAGVLTRNGAVSAETAEALADAARTGFAATVGIAATGVAGPTEQEGKPVGTIYVAASLASGARGAHVQGYGDRENVRDIAVTAALDLARRMLLEHG